MKTSPLIEKIYKYASPIYIGLTKTLAIITSAKPIK